MKKSRTAHGFFFRSNRLLGLWSLVAGVWYLALWPLAAQQSLVFSVNGKNYRAEVSWNVKHAGSAYSNSFAHTLDFSKDKAFDLEVQFRFLEEVPPPEAGLLWGFQFRHGGNILAPTDGEKRARSARQFQRFQAVRGGSAALALIPKVWRQTGEGGIELLVSGPPTSLSFTPMPSKAEAPVAIVDTPAKAPVVAAPVTPPQEEPVSPTLKAESEAYAKAVSEADSTQRIKALIDFVEQYGAANPRSPNVQKALREVPLASSLPQPQSGGQLSYLLNYAVRPTVDTAKSGGWSWDLKNVAPGRFQLTLKPLSDTVTAFSIADLGKAPPFNRPRVLQPFDKVRVSLVGQTRRDFSLHFVGGQPPFMVYLSQDRVTRIRYQVPYTDTIWTLSKELCTVCKGGAHTLEVYTSDFSTLLLREEGGIYIHRVNYWLWVLLPALFVAFIFLFRKPAVKGWRYYRYRRQLRDIEAWERIIEKEAKRRKEQK